MARLVSGGSVSDLNPSILLKGGKKYHLGGLSAWSGPYSCFRGVLASVDVGVL